MNAPQIAFFKEYLLVFIRQKHYLVINLDQVLSNSFWFLEFFYQLLYFILGLFDKDVRNIDHFMYFTDHFQYEHIGVLGVSIGINQLNL